MAVEQTALNEPSIRDDMLEEHRELERIFETLTSRVIGGDREQMQDAWAAFEQSLRAHLADEERHLLPAFEFDAPAAAAAIRSDHARFRSALDELAVELDLHALRVERVRAFLTLLREHAKREERELYEWGETHLARAQRKTLRDDLRQRLRAYARV